MYNYYQQQQMYNLKGRPVSSLEEVRASAIDFDGSIFYFPDLSNNKIYTKQINLDGSSTVNLYELKPIPKPVEQDYITRNEFNELLQRIAALQSNSADKPAPQDYSDKF